MHRLLPLILLIVSSASGAAEYAVYRVFTTAPVRFVVPADSHGPAYFKGREGRWQEAATSVGPRPGTAEVRLDTDQVSNGKTWLVVNKPEWVELNDTSRPNVVSLKLGARPLEDSVGAIDLDSPDPGEVVQMTVADAANRISMAACSARLDGKPASIQVRHGVDPKEATLSFAIPRDCGFGRHTLVLRAGDEAPEANAVERAFTFAWFGVDIAQDGKEVVLHTATASYAVPGKAAIVHAPDISPKDIRVALIGTGGFLHTEELKCPPEIMIDEPDRKIVIAKAALYQDKATKPSDDYDFMLELEIRRGFPGLLVTSRAVATRSIAKGYKFWSEFMAGDHYVGSDGKRYEWHPRYADIEPQGWIYLPPSTDGGTGYGLITNGRLDEYLGNCALIFTKPKHYLGLKPGDEISVKFAVVPASGPDDVREQARQIEDWLCGELRSAFR